MFRFAPRNVHVWQDIIQNIGKLSLAGLFVTGSFFLARSFAAENNDMLKISPQWVAVQAATMNTEDFCSGKALLHQSNSHSHFWTP